MQAKFGNQVCRKETKVAEDKKSMYGDTSHQSIMSIMTVILKRLSITSKLLKRKILLEIQ